MTESLVRAFLLGALSAWLVGVLRRRVGWWLADLKLRKISKKRDFGPVHYVSYPHAKPQGSDVVAVKETDPWPENPPRRP